MKRVEKKKLQNQQQEAATPTKKQEKGLALSRTPPPPSLHPPKLERRVSDRSAKSEGAGEEGTTKKIREAMVEPVLKREMKRAGKKSV